MELLSEMEYVQWFELHPNEIQVISFKHSLSNSLKTKTSLL